MCSTDKINTKKVTRINNDLLLSENTDGLTFGTDAYLLYAYMDKSSKSNALEIGSGSGVISLLCASKDKFSKIYALEVQRVSFDLICENVELNKLTDKIVPLYGDVREFKSKDIGFEFDVIFTNPPYMLKGAGKANVSDSKNIARHEIFGTIGDFAASSSRLLKHGGYFYAVYRPDRLMDMLHSLRENKLEPKKITFVHPSKYHEPCLVLVKAKKGAKPSLKITKPLILKNCDGTNTEEIDHIYEYGEFDEQY